MAIPQQLSIFNVLHVSHLECCVGVSAWPGAALGSSVGVRGQGLKVEVCHLPRTSLAADGCSRQSLALRSANQQFPATVCKV